MAEKVKVEPPAAASRTGELAVAVSVPNKPLTVLPAGWPASQMSVVESTTTVDAAAGAAQSSVAAMAARDRWREALGMEKLTLN